MKTADFNYVLPESLIAKKPLKERSGSRLLVLHRDGKVEHKNFFDLPSYLDQGDMLLINNTKVFPARLTGTKKDGKTMDILLVREKAARTWEVLSKGKFTGRLKIADGLEADIYQGTSARFLCSGDLMDLIWKYGDMPLPPYIRRTPDQSDKQTYQTVYAINEGSIAAPTAGLHFTALLLDAIASKGVKIRELTLHVGAGTFRPIRTKMVGDHSMDMEYFEIPKAVITEIQEAKASGKRIVAVGTTTTRSLEGYFSGRYNKEFISKAPSPLPSPSRGEGCNTTPPLRGGDEGEGDVCGFTNDRISNNGSKTPASPVSNAGAEANKIGTVGTGGSQSVTGATDIFIHPGYAFKAIDSLITNFHLPRSTPLMLVCALAGKENIFNAYNEATANGYRFLSYGDAMLIL